MNIYDELKNRWFRVFEQPTDLDKSRQLQQMPHNVLLGDVKFLQDRVKELEEEVSGLHSQVSSKYGPLVDLKDGEVFYRINGLFVRLMSVYSALDFFVKLLNTDESIARKFRKEFGDEIEKEVKNIFKNPL